MRSDQVKKTGDGLLANVRYRRKWKRLTSVLSIFVVIGTVSSLMLPAITMNQYICGKEEHVHGADCYTAISQQTLTCSYESLGIHRHSRECYDAEENLLCELADFAVHTHDSSCFDANGLLVCPLAEVKEHQHDDSCCQIPEIVVDEGHTHVDQCYEQIASETPICGAEESSGHHHGKGCYATGTELLCTIPESQGHSHLEECFGEDGEILCGQEESSGHTHEAGCFAEAGTLLCATPESDGHQHSEECFGLVRGGLICTEEEREPVIEQGGPELICEKEEVILHTHKGTCFEYDAQGNAVSILCEEQEVKEHQHGEGCFTQQEVTTLICTLPEHTHTDECREEGPTEPSEETTEPSEEPAEPGEDTTEPSEETTEPSEEPAEPGEDTTKPSEEATEPSEEPAGPDEDTTEPSEEATEPSEEPAEPGEDTTEPSEKATEPLEEATESPGPTAEELTLAQAAIDIIQALPDPNTLAEQWNALEQAGSLDQWNDEIMLLEPLLMEARSVYENVPQITQGYVTNLSKLISLEELLSEQQEQLKQLLQREVDLVILQIESLPEQEALLALLDKPELTEEERVYLTQIQKDIENAYSSWDILRPYQKAQVTNFSRLETLLPLIARIRALEEHPVLLYTDESCTEPYLTSVSIALTGQLPEGARVLAFPVDAHSPEGTALYAFDIQVLLEDGTQYQPQEPVTVTICGMTLPNGPLVLYHLPGEGAPEEILFTLEEGSIRFTATHFSVYVLSDAAYQNLPEVTLPTVGGPGIFPCILSGLALVSASLLAYSKKEKAKKGESNNKP